MSQATIQRKIPKAIARRLSALRMRLKQWVLVHGVGRWLMIALGVLAVDMLLDRVFKMDFAQRLIMLFVMAITIGLFFVWRVLKPLGKKTSDDALLHQIGTQYPELNESLISSAQLSRESDFESRGVSEQLAEATIAEGVRQAEKVDIGKVINGAEHGKNLTILAVCGLLSLGLAIGITQTNFLKTWFNRNILLTNDQWPQSTYLEIVGAEDGKLVLPRGVDHRQLVRITEDSRRSEVAVSLEIEGANGRTIHKMKQTGKNEGREHSLMIHNVSSELRMRASGGDDTTDWVQVSLVEPPAVTEIQLTTKSPDYTRLDPLVLEGTGPHRVLLGSQLSVQALVNKPLQNCQLRMGGQEFDLKPTAENPLVYQLMLPPDGGQLQGGQYEFSLTDKTGLGNIRASKFTIKIKEDTPPKIRASLLGISGLVVPRALVPVSYSASDDYGLSSLFFDCNWKDGIVSDDKPPRNQLVAISNFKSSEKIQSEVETVSVLELEQLKLQPDTSFRFSVNAHDNRPQESNTASSTEFLLRVVTEETLRADLLRREKEQRTAFEQAYNSQLELITNLQAVEARTSDSLTAEQFAETRSNELIGLSRDQKVIGTSADAIATRFEEFLVEVKNNRLDEAEAEYEGQTIEKRFDKGIVQPIRQMDSELISLASRNLDNCRRLVTDQAQLRDSVDQTVKVQQEILERMKTILDAMADSENFQAIVNDLLEVKERQKQIIRDLKKKQKPDQDIFDEDDIFDDN